MDDLLDIIENDTFFDVLSDYSALLADNMPLKEATRSIRYEYGDSLSDPEDSPYVLLAIAIAQMDHGRLQKEAKEKALSALDELGKRLMLRDETDKIPAVIADAKEKIEEYSGKKRSPANDNLNILNSICLLWGFTKVGNSFYRIHGDGVLQVLRYSKKQRPYYEETVDVGLYSLYGELYPYVLDAKSGNLSYNSYYLNVPYWKLFERYSSSNIISSDTIEGVMEFHFDPFAFQKNVIPFLNKTDDQKKLLEALYCLDNVSRHIRPESFEAGIHWTDMNKFAPLLFEGDYSGAEKVVMNHLKLFLNGHEDADFDKSFEYIDPRAEDLRQKYLLAKSQDKERINDYLMSCYNKNAELTAFCR